MPVRQQARELKETVVTACPIAMRQFRYFRDRVHEAAEAMAGIHIQVFGVSAQTTGTTNSRRQPRACQIVLVAYSLYRVLFQQIFA